MITPSVKELCDLGDQHMANEEWEEADKFFQQALSADSKSKRALLGRAVIQRENNYDYEQAQRLLNRCLYHYPGDPETLTEQGRLYADQGDHAKAIASFEQAINRDPTKREALQGKIQSLMAQGRFGDAHQLIESTASSPPRPPWLLLELAKVYIAEGAYDAAVEAFLDAGNPQALYNALTEQGDKASKDALSAAVGARLAGNAEALGAVAEAHKNWGDFTAAIEAFEQVVRAKPTDEAAHLQLIELLGKQERFNEAEAAYQNAVRAIGRASDLLLIGRARVFFNAGSHDHGSEAVAQLSDQNLQLSFLDEISDANAIRAFEFLVERQPNNTVLLRKAAIRLSGAGNTQRALELLERVLDLDQNDIEAVVSKGENLLSQGRLKDLDGLIKRGYVVFGSDNPELLSLTAQFLIASDRYIEAVRAAVSAGNENLIRVHVDSLLIGDVAKAEKLVNAAVAELPGSIPFLEAQGRLLLQQHNYDAAAKAWNAIWEKQPGNIEALSQEAFALRSARRFEEAAQVIDKAMRRASPSSRAQLFAESALLHYDQGKCEEAVQAFNSALVALPNYGFAHLWKIRVLRISGLREEAEAAYKQAMTAILSYEPRRAEIKCEMGRLHEAREEWKTAVDLYTEALHDNQRLVEAHFQKASALLHLNLNAEADSVVEAILKERGSENEVKEQAGWYYISKKDFRKAETQFQDILRRAPSDFAAVNGLGGLYFEQGKFDLAEQNFRRALEINESERVLLNNLAWALMRQVGASEASREALLAEAESYCRKAIELYPNYPNAHACLGIIAFKRGRLLECEEKLKHANKLVSKELNSSDLGALYAYLGRYEEAQKVLEKGRELDRYDTAARVELGNVYLQLGRTKDALTVLKEACMIDPQAEEPVRVMSIALCKAGDLIEALHVLRSAIRSQDRFNAPSLRVTLCRVLTELADKTDDPELYGEALKEVRLAITAQPNNPDAYFHAGVVCFKQRDYRAALKHFKQCHELDGNNFEAEQNLRKVTDILKEPDRPHISRRASSLLGVACFVLLLLLWSIYLNQPLATKETIRQIDSAMLLTLSPILLALIFVALMMPWLSRLKLPGGVEAELAKPKEQITSGPRIGPATVSLGTTISAGPK